MGRDRLVKVAASAAIFILLTVTGAQAASAQGASATALRSKPCPTVNDGGDTSGVLSLREMVEARRGDFLPMNRWIDATSGLHSRIDAGKLKLDHLPERVNRDMTQPMVMSIGNFAWRATSTIVQAASEFEILDRMACETDMIAAPMGRALARGVVPGLVGIGLIVAIYRAWKGSENPTKKIVHIVGMTAIFAIMLAGADQTSRRASDGRGTLGPGSPGWWVVSMNDVISSLGDSATRAMVNGTPTIGAMTVDRDAARGDVFHCDHYLKRLRGFYTGGSDPKAGSSMPLAISSMWEQAGLQAYVQAQFGSKNEYGARMYCRQLENRAGIPPDLQLMVLRTVPGWKATLDRPSHVYHRGSNNHEDSVGVFFASCRYVNGSWKGGEGQWGKVGSPVNAGDCSSYYEKDSGDKFNWKAGTAAQRSFNVEKSELWWGDGLPDLKAPQVLDFMSTWHGDTFATSTTLVFIYAASAVAVLVVFGAIALGVIIAKIVSVVMILMVFIMLAWSMVPSQQDQSKLGRFIKFGAGMMLYASLLSLVMSMVAIVTGFIIRIGAETFGPGSFASILMLGFAPVGAIVVLHIISKHAIGMPSLFKPGSALAFGAAAGGAGAALGVGVDRMMRRGSGAARGAAQGAANRLVGGRGPGRKRGDRSGEGDRARGERRKEKEEKKDTSTGESEGTSSRRSPWGRMPAGEGAESGRGGGETFRDYGKRQLGRAGARVRAFPKHLGQAARNKDFRRKWYRRAGVAAGAFALTGLTPLAGLGALGAAGVKAWGAASILGAAKLPVAGLAGRALWRSRRTTPGESPPSSLRGAWDHASAEAKEKEFKEYQRRTEGAPSGVPDTEGRRGRHAAGADPAPEPGGSTGSHPHPSGGAASGSEPRPGGESDRRHLRPDRTGGDRDPRGTDSGDDPKPTG